METLLPDIEKKNLRDFLFPMMERDIVTEKFKKLHSCRVQIPEKMVDKRNENKLILSTIQTGENK